MSSGVGGRRRTATGRARDGDRSSVRLGRWFELAKRCCSGQAPANNDGSSITSYTVTASPGGVTMTVPANSNIPAMTGLRNGTRYTLTVHATNAYGGGPESLPSSSVYVYGRPRRARRGSLARCAGRSRTATISWTPPRFDGGAAIYQYEVVAMPGAVSFDVTHPTTSVGSSRSSRAGTSIPPPSRL